MCGSAGGVLLQRLARAGFNVVGLEAGPFWDTERDWVSDEAGSHELYWEDPRVTGGNDPLALGANNCGQRRRRRLGSLGRIHPAACIRRISKFIPATASASTGPSPTRFSGLTTSSLNWKCRLPARPIIPGAIRTAIAYGPHPMGGVGNALIKGCTALNIPVSIGGPVAILSGSHGDRPHCIYRGFCIQGCKVGAKASTLVTHVPDALESGAEIRDRSMVVADRAGQAMAALPAFIISTTTAIAHFQRAKAVIIAGYSIETPRLLAQLRLPRTSKTVSQIPAAPSAAISWRRQATWSSAASISRCACTRRRRRTRSPKSSTKPNPKNDFARGFAIQTVGPLPIAFGKQMVAAKKAWGWGLRREMMDYNHWAAFGLLGEILPWPDNRVTLADENDRFGLPVAHVTFNLHDNDKKLIKCAKEKTMEVMHAAGATEVVQEARYAHLVGAARMGSDPGSSVVDKFGRTHDIANLFVCDGSILPTQGSANPGLTIQALAARTADYLISQGSAIFTSNKRDMMEPPLRSELAPPGTYGRGAPRLK